MPTLETIRQAVHTAAAQYPVKRVELFGSYANGTADEHSDVDFLVDFDTAVIPDYPTNFFELKHSLEAALGRSVDLVEEQAIRNPIFKRNVERTKTVVYGGKNEVGKAERPLRRLERG